MEGLNNTGVLIMSKQRVILVMKEDMLELRSDNLYLLEIAYMFRFN